MQYLEKISTEELCQVVRSFLICLLGLQLSYLRKSIILTALKFDLRTIAY